jgi:Zn-dependent protease
MSDPRPAAPEVQAAALPQAAPLGSEAAPLAPSQVVPGAAPKKRGIGNLLWLLIVIGATKAKSLLLLLKLLPAGKLLLTSLSMLAMVAAEAQYNGLPFAVGFVLLILIHELGHGYAIKQAGLEAGWPVFIPFIGAMISMKGLPQDRSTEANIAYGGPFAGGVASLLVLILGSFFESRSLLALAYTGFFLNLFNMTPLSPLDGGRIAQAFSRRAWVFGAVLLGAMFLSMGTPQLLLIGLMALPRILGRAPPDERPLLEPKQQRAWAVRYFGLCVFLAAAMYISGRWLHPPSA